MTDNTKSQILAYPQLKKLRTALAIARACVVLSVLQQESEATVLHDQAKRVTYLTELFSRIHREMFQDWKEQATVNHRPGSMTDAEKRKVFRLVIESLVLDDGGKNQDSAIFDNNGFVIHTGNIAERLSLFYQKMRIIRPFSYGNRLTLDFFMVALGNLPAFKAVYEQGIDFRRLDANDTKFLHDAGSQHVSISIAFQHALDPQRTKNLQNCQNDYGRWPENKKFVAGIPFLSHKTAEGIECLVTVNGGLVPLNSIDYTLFSTGLNFADYPLSIADKIIAYLPNTESLRVTGKYEIDGISIDNSGLAPLFCLDVNMLTGLRLPAHNELMESLRQCEGDDALIFALAGNEDLKNKMLAATNDYERLRRGVEIAYDRLNKITLKLEQAKQAIFDGKSPDYNPRLFMCLGGAGSGKTAVKDIAYAHCGENFVITSLDEFRKISDLYRVLTAANHHSDDYVFVEPFANRLRTIVAEHAKNHGFNILYDGTGIPYKSRYSRIVEQFKNAGFKTWLTAVDAFIVKPQGREVEIPRTLIINVVKQRFEKTGRALPWVVTVDKHIRAPASFLDALEHHALEKISLFANDGEKGRHYLVAESFDFSDEEIDNLQHKQRTDSLLVTIKYIINTHKDSTLRIQSANNRDYLEELINKNPGFDESNVAYQVYSSKNTNRVLLVYNTRRMVDFIEKRQLNPNASGVSGLLHKPLVLSFHVDPQSDEPWRTSLQGSIHS